jgi:hypothetical protein
MKVLQHHRVVLAAFSLVMLFSFCSLFTYLKYTDYSFIPELKKYFDYLDRTARDALFSSRIKQRAMIKAFKENHKNIVTSLSPKKFIYIDQIGAGYGTCYYFFANLVKIL